MTRILGMAAVVLVTGCAAMPLPQSAGGASAAASDGQAARLTPGMSENAAFEIFGPESGFERNPADFDESCLSYAYGSAEAPRYVHARFRNGQLVQATDGHAGLCTYAEPVAPA